MKYLKNLDQAEANIGDEITIHWVKKDFYGKSVRRNVIDNILEAWRKNTYNNLQTFIDSRICKGSVKKSLKELKAIVKGEKACELSIFKRHKESKDWFRCQVEALNNVQGAVVIGVNANFHQGSKIAPFNISYMDEVSFFKYTVMVHGLDKENRHVAFEIELLGHEFKKK